MVLLLPHAKLHALLPAVQVSTQDNIPIVLVNVSRSPEVALDAMQRSVLISASRLGSAEHFYASIQCGYYHHGVPLPIQLHMFLTFLTPALTYILGGRNKLRFIALFQTRLISTTGVGFNILSALILSASEHVGVSTYHGTNHGAHE